MCSLPTILEINIKSWKTITIKNIPVKKKIEIGFLADGTVNASCQVDDVSLVKN